jgi:3-hydroxybutyryl-CoA dehydrogenase
MDIRNVGVIGAGTMGNGIAQVFAMNGRSVVLVDVSQALLDRATANMTKSVRKMAEKGGKDPAVAETELKSRVRTTTDVEALSGVDLAVEAIVENGDVKLDLFRKLDAVCPAQAILASNTSSISLTVIAAATKRPEKVIGMHFMNPVPVMKLVEVIRGLQTSDETTAVVKSLSETMGKTAVECRDFPGFVSNRVLLPMINEAIYCLHEGVADAAAIDTIMKLGMNHPMGPLALADFIGLDTCLYIMEVLHEGLGEDKYRPCPLLRKHVEAGWLGKKTGRGFYEYTA